MKPIVIELRNRVKKRLREIRRTTHDPGLAMRCQMVLQAAKGRMSQGIADALGCSRSWVSRVLGRFQAEGEAGLLDRREDNGQQKLDEWYLGQLHEVVAKRPPDYGYRRPTWTRELLVEVMARLTGQRVHVTTMSRALATTGARRGRPRPVVRCPWSKPAKNRRLREIRRVLKTLPKGDVAVYLDEVDIHLNPKIGLDWMNRDQQKEVVTPGQNEKRYLAGALNAATRELTVVEAGHKNSVLFIALLKALREDYPQARRIHVILDNYRIHSSQMSRAAVAGHEGRIVLHFLPPYCPNENRIERLWEDLHAEVTRNHGRATMEELMQDVRWFIRKRSVRRNQAIRKVAA